MAGLNPVDRARLTLAGPMEETAEQPVRWQVGTVVDKVDQDEGRQHLAEFADLEEREYTMAYLAESELLSLHYQKQSCRLGGASAAHNKAQSDVGFQSVSPILLFC